MHFVLSVLCKWGWTQFAHSPWYRCLHWSNRGRQRPYDKAGEWERGVRATAIRPKRENGAQDSPRISSSLVGVHGIVSTRFVSPTELIQIQDSRVRYVHAFGRSTEDRPSFGSGKKITREKYVFAIKQKDTLPISEMWTTNFLFQW